MNRVLRNWLVLVACLLALSAMGSYLDGTGMAAAGAAVGTVAEATIGLLAVVDGLTRLAGRSSLLGAGRGWFRRLLAGVQVLLGALLLAGLVVPVPPFPPFP